MKLSLIFPAYNEAAAISQVLDAFFQYCQSHHIDHEMIVVNDGSRDTTRQQIIDFIRTHPTMRLIDHARNQGYGTALRSGFSAASGDYIFFTDSDGQFQPDDLARTLPLADPNAIVLGYRYHRTEGLIRQWNAGAWGWLVSRLLGFRVRDLNCAWKLFPRSLVAHAPLFSRGAFISAELLYYAQRHQLAFQEISVRHLPRTAGSASGARPLVIVRAFRELVAFLRLHQSVKL